MREKLIERLNSIKETEDNFKNKWWSDNYFSYSMETNVGLVNTSKHISKIDFYILNDEDLLRLFEYIIIYRNNDQSENIIPVVPKAERIHID